MKEGTEKYVWPSWPAFVWGIRCIKGNRVRCWKTRLRTDPGGGQGEMWLEPTNLGVNRDWNRSWLMSFMLCLWYHLPTSWFPVMGSVLLERTNGVCACLSFPPYLSHWATKGHSLPHIKRKWVPRLLTAFFHLSLSCSQLVRTLGGWSGSISAHWELRQGEVSSLTSHGPPRVQQQMLQAHWWAEEKNGPWYTNI